MSKQFLSKNKEKLPHDHKFFLSYFRENCNKTVAKNFSRMFISTTIRARISESF